MDFLPEIPKEYIILFKIAIVVLYCIGASLIIINRKKFEQAEKFKPKNLKREYAYASYIIIGSIIVWTLGNLWTMYVFPTTEEDKIAGTGNISSLILRIYQSIMFIVALFHLNKEAKQKTKDEDRR